MITYAIVAACFVFCAVYNGMPGGSSLIKGLFVPICAYVIMAVSLNLTVGILGELSLGHAGFMCLGAFVGSTFSILTQESLTSVWIRFPLAILIGGMWEFYRMARREDIYPLKWLGLVTGTALFVASFLLAVSAEQVTLLSGAISVLLWLLPVFILLIPLMFVCELFLKRARPAADVGATLGGVFYVAVPLSMMAYLPLLTGEGGWNPWVILAYIFIIWANDVFAYLVGVSVGRHHLYERISPNKSWEGFFGGIVGAIAMGCLAAWWLDGSYWLWCCLAAIAAVSGVLGDLIESMFKRAADVKDSGNILPGHGGWLDRFDALIFSLPFVVAYLVLLHIS